MGWLENVIFENKEIVNERLELSDKNSLYFLNSNLTLKNCTLVLKVPARRLVISRVRFIDCTIEVKQELKNHDWSYAFLKGCQLSGPFLGCDFGRRLPILPGREDGGIEDCDFTEARLDSCRFHGCDPRTLRFPPWPCFTILDPIGRSRELRSVQWPGRFGQAVVENLHKNPPSTVAETFYAPADAKAFGFAAEELKPILEKFDFIVY
jgi:hypothetical protein